MDHPLVEFHLMYAPLLPKKRAKGLMVGDYLVVSYADANLAKPTYAIYNILGHKVFKKSYATMDAALEKAELMDKHFKDFFPIWEEYPNADVFSWAKGTIENGEEICRLIQGEK